MLPANFIPRPREEVNSFRGAFLLRVPPGDLPAFRDFSQSDHALQRAVRPRFRGLWPLKYSFPGLTDGGESLLSKNDTERIRLLAERSALFSPFCAPAVNDFHRRAKLAALRYICLSACAGKPAPSYNHKPPADGRNTKTHGARKSASGGFRFPRCAHTRHQSLLKRLAAYFSL